MSKVYRWQELGLQSLDIVACAGLSPMSQAIVKAQKYIMGASGIAATWSHIGGITHNRGCTLLMQESTTLNAWAKDICNAGTPKKGVQHNDFEEWLYHYNGSVWVRKLYFERTPEFYRKDRDFWLEHMNDPYESGIMGTVELALCGLPFHRWIKYYFPNYVPLHTKDPHCSEHQGNRMKEVADIWSKDVLTNKLPPHQWYSKIDMLSKYQIGEPILIKEIL